MSKNNQLSLFDDSESEAVSREEPKTTSEENKISLLALNEVPGVGFATIRGLFNAFNGDLAQVWDADDEALYKYLHTASNPQPIQVIHQIKQRSKEIYAKAKERYSFLKRRKIEIVFRGTESYPQRLYNLKSPPLWLFVEGNLEILHDAAIVAVIGTRDPTKEGLNAAKRLSVLLVTRGCIILSGLAEGIDEVGHRTAVDYGTPTIAVLGHGIDVVFPAATVDLRHQIVERDGAVISEYLPQEMYNRERFVQRNRIQAALAKAVVVVEGKVKSGTAHTVRFARELHRPVLGVRIGPPLPIPQQELLHELMKEKHPVYDLDDQRDRNQLNKYLRLHLSLEQKERAETAQLFRGLLKEFERLAQDYDARESDIDWLIGQIGAYRDNVERTDKDDDQSSHP